MASFALFVDAGHLYAEGGKLCCGTHERSLLLLDFGKAVDTLKKIAGEHAPGKSVLRTYWYDAARNATPTPSHLALWSVPGVQLRLGRLTRSGQKGVDSKIVRDLMVLARNRAMDAAYLLAGDDDLCEGVQEAQELGVKVTLIGIESLAGTKNQSLNLVRTADDLITLDKARVATFLQRRLQLPLFSAEACGKEFAETWLSMVSGGDVINLNKGYPHMPAELWDALRTFGAKRRGASKISLLVAREIKEAFWRRIKEHSVS